MRTDKQFYKCITLTVLLFTGFAAGSIAQDTSTIDNPETKAPVILTTTPTGGEMNADLNSSIEITFNSEMDETTINGTTLLLHATSADSMHEEHGEMLDDPIKDRSAMKNSENSWQDTTGAVKGTISYSNKVAVFTPDKELKEGTQYTFIVTNGVKSLENIALKKDHYWSFTTTGTSVSANFDKQNDRSDMDRKDYSTSTTDAAQKNKTNMINLGKAGHYVILAKTNINKKSESMITGHIGEGSVVNSTQKEKDIFNPTMRATSDRVLVLQSNQSDTTSTDVNEAIEDMMSAYSDVSKHQPDDLTTHNTESFHHDPALKPGVHEWDSSIQITSDVTLSGSADDVWVFKTDNNLTVDENTVFTLDNGARAENIFWHVEGEVTIGKNANFEGIILSMNEITLEKGAKLDGRMFSQTSITLDDNTVTEPRSMAGQTSSTNR